MYKRVTISDFNVKVPGFTDKNDFTDHILSKDITSCFQEFVIDEGVKISIAEPQLDADSVFHPKKSDIKAMRKEVIAGTYCMNELIHHNPAITEPLNCALYVATGLSFDDYSNGYKQIIDLLEKGLDDNYYNTDSYEAFFPYVPPLLALRTLTNALESFGAQYTNIAGDNTTYGNTSASGYYALLQGYNKIKNGECEVAVVGSINGGGSFSFHCLRNFTAEIETWKESMCSAFLILESYDSVVKRNGKALLEIDELFSSGKPPVLSEPKKEARIYQSFQNKPWQSLCIYSGGNTESEFIQQKNAIEAISENSFSLFPSFGNTGTASLFLSICAAIALSRHGKSNSFSCFEADSYSREFMVNLKIMQGEQE